MVMCACGSQPAAQVPLKRRLDFDHVWHAHNQGGSTSVKCQPLQLCLYKYEYLSV